MYELPSEMSMLPSSSGAPTNTVLSVTQTPRPKSSFAVTLVVTNLSSIKNSVLYLVAVYAAPEPVLKSLNSVSCKSNVVAPESNAIVLEFPKFSAPITNLVPLLSISIVLPKRILEAVSGAFIVCCNV